MRAQQREQDGGGRRPDLNTVLYVAYNLDPLYRIPAPALHVAALEKVQLDPPARHLSNAADLTTGCQRAEAHVSDSLQSTLQRGCGVRWRAESGRDCVETTTGTRSKAAYSRQEERDDSAAVVLEFGYLCGHNAQSTKMRWYGHFEQSMQNPTKAAHHDKSVPFFSCRDFEFGRKFPLLEID
jgi:hypothetical protein